MLRVGRHGANTDDHCEIIDGVESCKVAIQAKNLRVDNCGYVRAFDRANTGMHILAVTSQAKKIATFNGG